MATQIDNIFRTFNFATATSANVLVRASSTAGNAEASATNAIGVLQDEVAANTTGDVKLFHATQFGTVTAAAVTVGTEVFATTGGAIRGTLIGSAVTIGVALETADAGSTVEYAVLR